MRQICLPRTMQWEIIDVLHRDLSAGGCHHGFQRTLSSLYQNYYFKNAATMVKSYVQSCPACQQRKMAPNRNYAMQETDTAKYPLHKISIDVAGPLVGSGPNKLHIHVSDL